MSALRTNAMRYLPHYFSKGQLTKLFFCFPDPQFKQRNHRRRIVRCDRVAAIARPPTLAHALVSCACELANSTALLAEYAYLLAPGGILYTITDVEELHNWHVEKGTSHPCFTRIEDEQELVRLSCVLLYMQKRSERLSHTILTHERL